LKARIFPLNISHSGASVVEGQISKKGTKVLPEES
jgi:hypothetical protein